MGCDIHPVIQRISTYWDGEPTGEHDWELAAVPDDCRHYGFFAGIAAVRGNYDTPERALAANRGIPEDLVRADYEKATYDSLLWLDDNHSASWFTLAEAEAWTPDFENEGQYLFDKWLALMRFVRDHWGLKSHQVRAVFTFDN